MSRLRGHRPKALNPTFDRRLTARPAVFCKNVRNRAVTLPVLQLTVPAGRSAATVLAKTVWICFRSGERSCNSSSFDARTLTGGRCRFYAIPTVGFGAVERLIGRLQDMLRI